MTALETFIGAMTDIQRHGPVYKQIKKLSDGVYEKNLLLSELNKVKTPWSEGGGALIGNIEDTVQKAEHYYGSGKISTTKIEPLDTYIVLRTWLTIPVTYDKTDIDQNKGDKLVGYVSKRIDSARRGMERTLVMNLLGTGVLDVAGSTLATPCLKGLQYFLSTVNSTGTVANISKATNTAWRHQVVSMLSIAGMTTAKLRTLVSKCTHSDGPPTFGITCDAGFGQLWALAKTEKWPMRDYVLKKAYDLGYPDAIDFMGIPIVNDKCMTGTTNAGILSAGDLKRIFFLNTNSFRFEVDPSDDIVLNDKITIHDQHTIVQHVTWNGAFVITNPRDNGVGYWA